MTIEIHRPELEALIHERMASGTFGSVEDFLMQALTIAGGTKSASGRKSLAQLFAESPFRGLDLEFPRDKDPLRSVEL